MKLNHLFKDRVANRWHQYLKYLRYVFNDHAVLALFIPDRNYN
jgi:ABC-2 type transport system permease protein